MERLAAPDGDPAERAETLALAGEVREAMEELKPQERRVIGLLALGYSYRDGDDRVDAHQGEPLLGGGAGAAQGAGPGDL